MAPGAPGQDLLTHLILREGGVIGEHRRWRIVQAEPERLGQGCGRGQGCGTVLGENLPRVLEVVLGSHRHRRVSCKSQERESISGLEAGAARMPAAP